MDGIFRSGRRRSGSFHIDSDEGLDRGVQFMTPCYEGRNDTNPEPLDLSKLCLEEDLFGSRTSSDSCSTEPGGQSCSSEDEVVVVRGRSRSRSVHENDDHAEDQLPRDIIDCEGSTGLGSYGADIIEYDAESDYKYRNTGRSYSTSRQHQLMNMGSRGNCIESNGERRGPLQHREVLALKKGLEEANQSLNKNREHEDEEERMAADAEKRKRMLLNGRSLSADSTMSRRMKILMLGDSGVGKSSLILRWTMDTFSPSLVSTVGVNFKTRKVTLLGESTQVQVWDTAGQEHFHKITTSYYRGANGIMLVYDVSDQKTFDNVHYWIKNIKSHASSSVEIVLVGNKSDLRGSDEVSGPCVEACQGKELAETFGISFFETSAKESHNVDDAFMKLAGNIAAAMAPAFPVHGSGLSASTSASELNGRYGAASASGSASAASQHSLEHKNAADDASDKPAKLGKSGRLFGFGKSKKNKDYRKSPLPSHESGYSGHSNSSNSQSNAGGSSKLRSLGKSKTRAVDGGDDDDRDESDSDREKCIIS